MPPLSRDSADQILARLPVELRVALVCAARLAAVRACRLWLVGGMVRDVLCGMPPGRDVDLAVEGDAPALARAFAAATGGRLVATHTAFGTATVELAIAAGPALLIDFAGSRVEHYPHPAALPEVQPAPIEDDLLRRDFSVSAMAIELRAEGDELRAGRMLDPFGGRADLATSRLRLLHATSLRDDPTRLLRGLRLAARLDLQPDPATMAQIQEALTAGYLGLLSAERVLAELCLCLEEPRPDAVLRLADTWGVTPQVLPGLCWNEALAARSERLTTAPADGPRGGPLVWAGLLLYELENTELAAIAARYPLPSEANGLLRQLPALRALVPRLGGILANSAIDRLLRPFSEAAITVLHYAEPTVAAVTVHYLRALRPARAPLDGNDLQRLGLAPGPVLGRMLEALRVATLDGDVSSREQAEVWVRQQLAQRREA